MYASLMCLIKYTYRCVKLKHVNKLIIYFRIAADDHSRVILKTINKDQGGYFNANYIEASIN